MGKHNQYECLWSWKHIRDGKVIFEFEDKPNILVDEGEKAMVDTFFRKNADLYFAADTFYIGLYSGTVVEATVLATISEASSNGGYARIAVERSTVGFPTLDQHEGHWRVTSKEVTFTAAGGDIDAVNGAFLCTSSDGTGSLIGAVAAGTSRIIFSGDSSIVSLKFRQK